jgi:hypothetical protein
MIIAAQAAQSLEKIFPPKLNTRTPRIITDPPNSVALLGISSAIRRAKILVKKGVINM